MDREYPPRHFGLIAGRNNKISEWQNGNPADDEIIELGWRVAMAIDNEWLGFGPLFDAMIAEDMRLRPERWRVHPAPFVKDGDPF